MRRVRLQVEVLEGRLAPACTLSGQTVNCDGGNDNVEVRHILDKLQGPFQIYNNGGFLGKVNSTSPVIVNGGGGSNSLRVNDAAEYQYPTAQAYWFRTSPAPEIVIGSLAILYTGMNNYLRLDTSQVKDLIYVISTPVGPSITVNSGNGNDDIWVTHQSENLDNLGDKLTINGQGGSDWLCVWDQYGPVNSSYAITSLGVVRAGRPSINYSAVEKLEIDIALGGDVNVNATATGTLTWLHNWQGTVKVTPATGRLANMGGPLRIWGLGGSDEVYVYDQNSTSNGIYTFHDSFFTKLNTPSIELSGIEYFSLKSGKGRDLIILGPFEGGAEQYGGLGEDVLIAGTTSWGDDPVALKAIMDEWSRTDISYDERATHLINGGGVNGTYTLNTSTVTGTGEWDQLYGGQDRDLFFADPAFLYDTDHDPATETLVTILPLPIPPPPGPDRAPVGSHQPDEVAPLAIFRDDVNVHALIDDNLPSDVKSQVIKRVSQPVKPMKSRQLLAPDEAAADIFPRL
jgi:hypothetical protein